MAVVSQRPTPFSTHTGCLGVLKGSGPFPSSSPLRGLSAGSHTHARTHTCLCLAHTGENHWLPWAGRPGGWALQPRGSLHSQILEE